MREAAGEAVVGDDVYGEDPSINQLEADAASLLGTESALYCVSGTMANQVAARTHTDRGQEVMLERASHMYKWELAGLAQLGSLQTRPLSAPPRGDISAASVRENAVEADGHRPGTGLLCLENTHNSYGGVALEPAAIDGPAEAADAHGIPTHLDGARLGNAAVAHAVDIARYTESVDSVMLSLSKGLGAPVGSILAGSTSFIDQARRVRKLFGGGWRQAGVIAAPGQLALQNIERLAADHRRAERLSTELAALDGLHVTPAETNIVLVDVSDVAESAQSALDRCENEGVLGTPVGEETVRFVTHTDIDDEDISAAIDAIGRGLAGVGLNH